MTWLPGWYYRKQINVSAANVVDDLTNFPLNVPFSRSEVNYHNGHLDGDDLRFTAADGVTLLPHVWTGWTDDNYAGAYVKVPSISSSMGATLYAYYGNVSASDASNAPSVLVDYAVFAPLRNFVDGQQELASGLVLDAYHVSAQSNGVLLDDGYILLGNQGAASEAWVKLENANLMSVGNQITLAAEESLPVVPGPYTVDRAEAFQTDVLQAETFIPGIFAGHTHGI